MGKKKNVKKKGKKQRKNHLPSKKWKKYKVEEKDGKEVIVKSKECPKCGRGVFLAEHKDRWHCGRCGYTEFKR